MPRAQDAVVAGLQELPTAVEAERLPDEAEPGREVKFGWPRVGEAMKTISGTVGAG